jgi:hypothetical protein
LGCGRLGERLCLAIRGSPDGVDELPEQQTSKTSWRAAFLTIPKHNSKNPNQNQLILKCSSRNPGDGNVDSWQTPCEETDTNLKA